MARFYKFVVLHILVCVVCVFCVDYVVLGVDYVLSVYALSV